ncbi:unnamed protein product [Sphagnum balticum]
MCAQRAIDLRLVWVAGALYAVGGDVLMPTFDSRGGPPKGSIERLGANGAWELVAEFPTERHGISVTCVGSVIYIFGGSQVHRGTWIYPHGTLSTLRKECGCLPTAARERCHSTVSTAAPASSPALLCHLADEQA